MFGSLLAWYTIHIFGSCCLVTEFCSVQNSLYVQLLRSPILATLLHVTPAAGVSQTLRRSTWNAITELSQRAPTIFGWAAITLGTGRHFSSVLFLSFFCLFSSPILSHRRLDVCHTSTHGVVLVRIYDAGLERVARGSLKYRTQKNRPKIRHLGTIAQLCRAMSSQLRHISTIEKKLVK